MKSETGEATLCKWPNDYVFRKIKAIHKRNLRSRDSENHFWELNLLFYFFSRENFLKSSTETFKQRYKIPTSHFVEDPQFSTHVEYLKLSNFLADDEYFSSVAKLKTEQQQQRISVWYSSPVFVWKRWNWQKTFIYALYQAYIGFFCTRDCNFADPTVLLTSYTARAASHISGSNIHSAPGFLSGSHKSSEILRISRNGLHTLQQRYVYLKCLIIEEIRFLVPNFLILIDQRLREILCWNQIFGVLLVIVVGDLYQLSPVFDKMVFEVQSENYFPRV